MGNTFSSNNNIPKNELKPKNINQIIDYIATYYILTMDFESLKKLNEKSYCDNLVVLTSEIIEKYFTSLEITYLAQRIKNGVEVNQLEKDNIVFFNKDSIENMDIGNDTIKKNRVCTGIAKFYIKISHIFAAIVMTINPVYKYKDLMGNTVKTSLYNKKSIPVNTDRVIERFNICENRLNSLYNKWDPKLKNVHPNMCDINVKEDVPGKIKSLSDEPGIPELMELYKDDNYDFKTGTFLGMSKKTAEMYKQNLETFYKVFTNNKTMGDDIKSFSDIKLRDYHNNPKCVSGEYKKNYDNDGSELFSEYADNLKKMMNNANKNQNELMDILNDIFVYTINPNTKKKQIRISPTLTEEKLELLILKTRKVIINLYLTCEQDYTNGIKIYEAIVDTKILESVKNQEKTLEDTLKMLKNPNDNVFNSSENDEIAKRENEIIKKQLDEIEKEKEKTENEFVKEEYNLQPMIQVESEKLSVVKPNTDVKQESDIKPNTDVKNVAGILFPTTDVQVSTDVQVPTTNVLPETVVDQTVAYSENKDETKNNIPTQI